MHQRPLLQVCNVALVLPLDFPEPNAVWQEGPELTCTQLVCHMQPCIVVNPSFYCQRSSLLLSMFVCIKLAWFEVHFGIAAVRRQYFSQSQQKAPLACAILTTI